jgi:hypothetical protein
MASGIIAVRECDEVDMDVLTASSLVMCVLATEDVDVDSLCAIVT